MHSPHGDIVQLVHHDDEEKITAEFKTEATEISEIPALDQFVAVAEIGSDPTDDSTDLGGVVAAMKSEITSAESTDGMTELVSQAVPQQFIILTRAAEGGAGMWIYSLVLE